MPEPVSLALAGRASSLQRSGSGVACPPESIGRTGGWGQAFSPAMDRRAAMPSARWRGC